MRRLARGMCVAAVAISGCQPHRGTELARSQASSTAAATAPAASAPPATPDPVPLVTPTPPPSVAPRPPPAPSSVTPSMALTWVRPKTRDRCPLEVLVSSEREEDGSIVVEDLHAVRVADAGGCTQTELWRAHSLVGTGCADPDPVAQQHCVDRIEPIDEASMPLDPKPARQTTPPEIVRHDFDFDGHRDVCVPTSLSIRGIGYSCWVFDAKKKAFRRVDVLDVYCQAIDAFYPSRRQLHAFIWEGNSQFHEDLLGWERGELVVLTRYDRYLHRDEATGEARFHDRRFVRRGKTLVKVSEKVMLLHGD